MTKAICLDFFMPNTIGRVFNSVKSNLISLMSKGIVIATIKKNLEQIDSSNSVSIINLFSKIVISSVDTHHTRAIKKTLMYGTDRKPNGYINEIKDTIIIKN